jgi:trimeric autotransporter adhesin
MQTSASATARARLDLAQLQSALLHAEMCRAANNTGTSACAQHGNSCLEGRRIIGHADACALSTCTNQCRLAKDTLTCFRAHRDEASWSQCPRCRVGDPRVMEAMRAEVAAGGSSSASPLQPMGLPSSSSSSRPSPPSHPYALVPAQHIGAAVSAPARRDASTAAFGPLGASLLANLTNANPELRRPARYGPTFAHLRVLSLVDAEPLFLNPAVSGQLQGRAAVRIRAELDAAEAAQRAAETAARSAGDLGPADASAYLGAAEYTAREVEMRRAAEAYVAAEGAAMRDAKAAVGLYARASTAASAQAQDALGAFAVSAAAAAARARDVTTATGALTALNEAHRARFARYSRSWRDAGVCAPSAAGLAHRMRMAAHANAAALFPGDGPGSIDEATGLAGAAGGDADRAWEVQWLADVGARAPAVRDAVPQAVAARIDGDGVTAEEAAAGAAAAASRGGSSAAAVAAAAYKAVAPHYSRAPTGGANPTSAHPVAYVHDLTTQMLLHIMPGLIAVTRARNVREIRAMKRAAGAGPTSSSSAASLEAGTIAGYPSAAAAAEASAAAAAGPQVPVEIRECADAAAQRLWTEATAKWQGWYAGERERTLKALRVGELNRMSKAAFLAAQATGRPDKASAAGPDRGSGGVGVHPTELYRRLLSDACHDACRKYFLPPLERLVEELVIHPETDPTSFTPEAFAAAAKGQGGAGAAAGGSSSSASSASASSSGATPALPASIRDSLAGSVAVGPDGRPVVDASSSSSSSPSDPDGVLLHRTLPSSNARVTAADVADFIRRQLGGRMPGEDEPEQADAFDTALEEDGDDEADEDGDATGHEAGAAGGANAGAGAGAGRAGTGRRKGKGAGTGASSSAAAAAEDAATLVRLETTEVVSRRAGGHAEPAAADEAAAAAASSGKKGQDAAAPAPAAAAAAGARGRRKTGGGAAAAASATAAAMDEEASGASDTAAAASSSSAPVRGKRKELEDLEAGTPLINSRKRTRKSASGSGAGGASGYSDGDTDTDGGGDAGGLGSSSSGLDVLSLLAGAATMGVSGAGRSTRVAKLTRGGGGGGGGGAGGPDSVFTVADLKARVAALRALAPPSLAEHPRAAAWLQWGLARASATASVEGERAAAAASGGDSTAAATAGIRFAVVV